MLLLVNILFFALFFHVYPTVACEQHFHKIDKETYIMAPFLVKNAAEGKNIDIFNFTPTSIAQTSLFRKHDSIKRIWAMVNFWFYRMLCWCAHHAPWSLVIQKSLLVLLHKSIKPYMRREERDYWPVLESKACCCFSIEKRSFVWNKTHPVVSQV